MENAGERKKKIEAFFRQYETRFNSSLNGTAVDVEATANAFAGSFIEASPLGVNCGQNNEQFKKAIPEGYAFYKSIGTTAMHILHMDITLLDMWHAQTKLHWKATYKKKNSSNVVIEFDVFYFTQEQNGQLKIFAYITGDEQKALRDHGLIPEQQDARQ